MPQWLRRNKWWVAAGVAVIVGASAVLWLARPSGPEEPPSRAREYIEFQACLLTGAEGLSDPATQPVWAGMQEASRETRAKVSYLAVQGIRPWRTPSPS